MKKTTRRILVIGGIVVLAGLAAYFALRGPARAVELTQPEIRTVREYVAEDAKTRLAYEYTVDMPVSGTVERIQLEVGDYVERGQVVARIDPYDLRQRIRQVQAEIEQQRAQITGVDVAKPKPEDIASAEVRVNEMRQALEISERAQVVAQTRFDEAETNYERAQGLFDAGAASEAYLDERRTIYLALREELLQSELQVERARQGLRQAELAYDRILDSIDDNEYQREALQAQIAALEAELAMLKTDLEKTEIKAPVSGPVLEKYIEDSRVLAEGTPLLEIGDMNSIEIESDILSEEITAVEVGDKVIIRGRALQPLLVEGDSITGVVTRIYPSGFEKISALGVEQQRVRTIIGFDNTDIGLRPGTSVDVEIITEEAPNALAVPDRAVFRFRNGYAVFVVQNGRAHIQPVEVGVRNEDWAEIRAGLDESAVIVAELTSELEEGTRIVPVGS